MRYSSGLTRRRYFHFFFPALWLSGLFCNPQASSFAYAQHPDLECAPSKVDFEWQRWNYYELLGLPRPSDAKTSVDAKSIRKAYRKQAQLWHPDKQLNSTSTKGESNARFAQISQAYEVLSDDWKRREYDLFLQYCDTLQEEEAAAERMLKRKSWSKLFSNFGDPFRVFEEFFFGKEADEEEEEDSWFFDMPPRNTDPIRITKHQDEFRDSLQQEEIVRISQTEEYAPDGAGRYYYRIVSQDFVKRMDPYTGNIVLQPRTRPYLREEGHHTTKPAKEEIPRQSLLFPGDVLTPKSALLVSPNRRYYAGLSPDCALIIMVDNAFGEDTIVWTSDSPFESSSNSQRHQQQQEYCFATLRGPHLVVALGRPEMPHRILWYSQANEEMSEKDGDSSPGDPYSYFAPASTYLAQLDNDGSLVVYKVWSSSPHVQELPFQARAWLAARYFMDGATRDDHYESLLLGSTSTYLPSTTATYKRCMYATGPSGCYRLVRRLYQLSLDIYFRIKTIMEKMDTMFDTWMDLIMEEESYLQALKQSTSGLGSQIVTKSARLVRRVLELILLRIDK